MHAFRDAPPRSRTLMRAGAATVFGLGLAVAWSPAWAHAETSSTRTVIIDDFETEHTVNTCTGEFGTLNRTFNGSAHTTVHPDGTVHFDALIRADDAEFIPDDPALPIFSGKELVHVSQTTRDDSATFTFHVRLWVETPDGAKASVMEVDRMKVDAHGGIVEFEKPVLICP